MEKIVFLDGTEFTCAVQAEPSVHHMKAEREWNKFTLTDTTVNAVKAFFIDNASYKHTWKSMRYLSPEEIYEDTEFLTDENDMPYIMETIENDLSYYCVAGDVVDCRNGNIVVYMGKKTEEEIYQETIDNLVLEALMGGF